MFVLILLFLGVCDCQGPGVPPSEPPAEPATSYVVNIESPVHVCGEGSEDYIDTSDITCERFNESTAVMYGVVKGLKRMDKLILELILRKIASGKDEIIFSHDNCDLCNELGKLDSDYFGYLQYMKIPNSCPFDAGSYEIDNMIVDMGCFDIKDQHCGDYIAELHIYQSTGENCKYDRLLLFILKIEISVARAD